MFYLKHFFLSIANYPIRGIFFILSTLTLTMSFHFSDIVESRFQEIFKDPTPLPYFFALLENQSDFERIERKLKNLPKVAGVEMKEYTYQKENLFEDKIVQDMQSDLPEKIEAKNYYGLKVILESNVSTRSVDLIKEYLTRLNDKELTMTPVKYSKVVELKGLKKYLSFLRDYGKLTTILSSFLLWIISIFIWEGGIKNHCFLLEKFQRRNLVAFKIMVAGLVTLFSLSTGMSLIWVKPSVVNEIVLAIVLILGSLFFIKKWKWNT